MIFKNDNTNNKGNEIEMQLKFLLQRFGINSNDILEDKTKLNNLIKKDEVKHIILDQNEIEKINDEIALDLINNLLVLNPNKRFTAKQALQSNYLQEFKEKDSLNLEKIKNPFDYSILLDSINKENFYQILDNLKNKLMKNK